MNKIKLILVCCVGLVSLNALELSSEVTNKIEDCRMGTVKSCYEVGNILTSGANAENQEKKDLGLEYIRRACTHGLDIACDTLGDNYYGNKHYQAARPLFEQSCQRGVLHACEALGTMYRDGQDVRPNDVTSREYYEKACELGSKDSCINVAIIYRGGFGVKKDRSMAKKYYKKACHAGSTAGCDRFKIMNNKDKGIEEPSIFSKIWTRIKSLFN